MEFEFSQLENNSTQYIINISKILLSPEQNYKED